MINESAKNCLIKTHTHFINAAKKIEDNIVINAIDYQCDDEFKYEMYPKE